MLFKILSNKSARLLITGVILSFIVQYHIYGSIAVMKTLLALVIHTLKKLPNGQLVPAWQIFFRITWLMCSQHSIINAGVAVCSFQHCLHHWNHIPFCRWALTTGLFAFMKLCNAFTSFSQGFESHIRYHYWVLLDFDIFTCHCPWIKVKSSQYCLTRSFTMIWGCQIAIMNNLVGQYNKDQPKWYWCKIFILCIHSVERIMTYMPIFIKDVEKRVLVYQ